MVINQHTNDRIGDTHRLSFFTRYTKKAAQECRSFCSSLPFISSMLHAMYAKQALHI